MALARHACRSFCILQSAFCILHSPFVLLPCSLALLLSFLACNPNPSNYREQMIVYTVLDPGLAHQVVVVDRTYRVDESAPDSIGVSGAIVKLWREGSAGHDCLRRVHQGRLLP